MLSNEEQSTIVEKLGEDITSVLETIRMEEEGLIAIVEDDQGHEHEVLVQLTYLRPCEDEEDDDDDYNG